MMVEKLKLRLGEEDGIVVVMVAVMLVILLLAGAFVVDLGQARQRARNQQNAADAGALAGAPGLPGSVSASPSAHRFAASYAFETLQLGTAPAATPCPALSEVPAGHTQCFHASAGDTWVYVTTPWGPDPVADASISAPDLNQVNVRVCSDTVTGLARIIGVTNIRPCRNATAINTLQRSPFQCALCVMRTSGSDALLLNGNRDVTVTGGDIVVNSSAACAARIPGNGHIIASGAITIVQPASSCSSGSGGFSPATTQVPAPIDDPLADLPLPPHPGCSMPPPQGPPASCNNITLDQNDTAVIHPGHWRKIDVSGNARLTMLPGIYVIRGDPSGVGLRISGGGSVTANGVMLVFTCEAYPNPCPAGQPAARLNWSGNGSFTLTAPTTLVGDLAKYNGMAIYYDRNNTAPLTLVGEGPLSVTGTIYALNSPLTITRNANTTVLNSAVVVNTARLDGNVNFSISFNADENVKTLGGIALIT
jgi:hypothetical protein